MTVARGTQKELRNLSKQVKRRRWRSPQDGGYSHLSDDQRRALIIKAFKDCGQEYTLSDIAKQFRYETGRKYEGS